MPYIDKELRKVFDKHIEKIGPQTTHVGDLNYCITTLCHWYIKSHGMSYTTLNDCLGVLEAAKLELYRRLVAPYEEQKIEENGDISILRK